MDLLLLSSISLASRPLLSTLLPLPNMVISLLFGVIEAATLHFSLYDQRHDVETASLALLGRLAFGYILLGGGVRSTVWVLVGCACGVLIQEDYEKQKRSAARKSTRSRRRLELSEENLAIHSPPPPVSKPVHKAIRRLSKEESLQKSSPRLETDLGSRRPGSSKNVVIQIPTLSPPPPPPESRRQTPYSVVAHIPESPNLVYYTPVLSPRTPSPVEPDVNLPNPFLSPPKVYDGGIPPPTHDEYQTYTQSSPHITSQPVTSSPSLIAGGGHPEPAIPTFNFGSPIYDPPNDPERTPRGAAALLSPPRQLDEILLQSPIPTVADLPPTPPAHPAIVQNQPYYPTPPSLQSRDIWNTFASQFPLPPSHNAPIVAARAMLPTPRDTYSAAAEEGHDEDKASTDMLSDSGSVGNSVLVFYAEGELLKRADKHRANAKAALSRRQRILSDRASALRNGNKLYALELYFQSQELEKEYKRLDKKAKYYFLKANNPLHRTGEIDLHGLRVPEAMEETEKAIRTVHESGGVRLRVITGRGKHSGGNGAALRSSILTKIQKEHKLNVQIEDGNAGVVIISW